MKTLKSLRKELFWDVDAKSIDAKKHSQYIIERILEFGNDKEVLWMKKQYSLKKIADIVDKSRVLRPQTVTLWKMLTKENLH